MNYLPTELKKRQQEADEMIANAKDGDQFYNDEPCNCGDHIRHNNGGNYHVRDLYAFDGGEWFCKSDTTCELTPAAEWEKINQSPKLNPDWSFGKCN